MHVTTPSTLPELVEAAYTLFAPYTIGSTLGVCKVCWVNAPCWAGWLPVRLPVPRNSGGSAAVDVQGGAGDVSRRLTSQKGDYFAHLLRGA